MAFDTTTLEHLGSVSKGLGGWANLCVRPDGRVLVVPDHRSILLRDTVNTEWAASLAHPAGDFAPRSFHFSADGLTMCAVFQAKALETCGRQPSGRRLDR